MRQRQLRNVIVEFEQIYDFPLVSMTPIRFPARFRGRPRPVRDSGIFHRKETPPREKRWLRLSRSNRFSRRSPLSIHR